MVGEVAQHQFQPAKFIDEAGLLLRESRGFLNSLPRQLNLILRRLNSPDHRSRIDVQGLDDFRRSIESSFNLLFLGIVIAALIISSSLIYPTQVHWTLAGMPGISLIGYILAIVFGVVAVINYFKKS